MNVNKTGHICLADLHEGIAYQDSLPTWLVKYKDEQGIEKRLQLHPSQQSKVFENQVNMVQFIIVGKYSTSEWIEPNDIDVAQIIQIHTTCGVYANGDMVLNGVREENLEQHIEFNKTARPGRGLFVDGLCVNTGYLTEEQVIHFTKLLKETRFKRTKDTQPYK